MLVKFGDFHPAQALESVNRKYLKQILKVKSQTLSAAIYTVS